MKKKFQFITAALAIAGMVIGSNAYAQAGTAVAASAASTPAASTSGSSACPVEANDSGTYGSPVNVVLGHVVAATRFDIHFYVGASASAAVVEAQLPDPDTHRTVFRVSQSYAAVKVFGIGDDGRKVLCESNLSYTITGRPAPRPAARPKAKAKPAAVKAAVPALRDDEPWAVRLGKLTVEDSRSRRRLSLAQRRVDDSTTLCTGQDTDGDGRGDLCETTTSQGWTALADARDVVEGDNRAVERAVDRSRGEARAIVEQYHGDRHTGAGPALRTVGAWSGIGTVGGAIACAIASAASGGLAAGFCIPALAIGGGVGATAGIADALTQ